MTVKAFKKLTEKACTLSTNYVKDFKMITEACNAEIAEIEKNEPKNTDAINEIKEKKAAKIAEIRKNCYESLKNDALAIKYDLQQWVKTSDRSILNELKPLENIYLSAYELKVLKEQTGSNYWALRYLEYLAELNGIPAYIVEISPSYEKRVSLIDGVLKAFNEYLQKVNAETEHGLHFADMKKEYRKYIGASEI